MIQVQNVPDSLHRQLQQRAKKRGTTLTDFIQEILEREVARPPAAEVFERIGKRTAVNLGVSAADLIVQEREERGSS